MKGDFTRFSHDPAKRYSGVLRQQGRVDLDADWNEHVAIVQHLERTEAEDVIGPSGVPKPPGTRLDDIRPDSGFAIADSGDDDLVIHPGRIYVDGILCENDPPPVRVQFPGASDSEAEVPAESIARFREGQLVEFAGDQGHAPVRVRIESVDESDRRLTLASGVGGIAEADPLWVRVIPTHGSQPDLPEPPPLERDAGAADLVYLDVWRRHVSAVEDPAIRERALGGPDTTTRLQTVWQVRMLRIEGADGEAPTCETAAERLPRPSGGRLSSGITPAPPEDDPCVLLPDEAERTRANRLYRIEIHDPGNIDDGATFKWSRDNGSVVYEIESFVATDGRKITLRRLGRDLVLSLKEGDWVEVVGDTRELAASEDLTTAGTQGTPGTLARVVHIDEALREVELSKDVSAHAGEPHPRLRRWDHGADAIPVVSGTTQLEGGLHVKFSGEGFRASDYWVFQTRTAGGWVEQLTEAPPRGIRHHYAPLALVTWPEAGGAVAIEDCRSLFPSLTHICAEDVCVYDDDGCLGDAATVQEALDHLCGQRTLRHAGGDGQEAPPNGFLPGFVEVGVEDGLGRRVQGVGVTFTVTGAGGEPPGQVSLPAPGATAPSTSGTWQTSVAATTDARGIARCQWRLGGGRRAPNELRAELTDPQAAPLGPPLPVFFRALSEATSFALRGLGGDGQEGPPDTQLPCPMIVGVEDQDGRAAAGATVRFEAGGNNGTVRELPVSGSPGPAGTVINVVTRPDGTARALWTLGADEGCRELTATLQQAPQTQALVQRFEARAERASDCTGNCNVTVKPGADLQAAINSLPAEGGQLCLCAGVYEMPKAVVVKNRTRLVIQGGGDATVLRPPAEVAFQFESCSNVEVRQLRIASRATQGGPPGLNGGLSFTDCFGVRVIDCSISTAGSFERQQSCIRVEACDQVSIEGNRLEPGTWQIGVAATNPAQIAIRGNRVRLGGVRPDKVKLDSEVSAEIGRMAVAATLPYPFVTGHLFRCEPRLALYSRSGGGLYHDFRLQVRAGMLEETGDDPRAAAMNWLERVAAGGPEYRALTPEGYDHWQQISESGHWYELFERLLVDQPGPDTSDLLDRLLTLQIANPAVNDLAEDFQRGLALEFMVPETSIEETFGFVARAIAAKSWASTPEAREVVNRMVDAFHVVNQGIVVAGSRADTVSITDNVIDDVIQGIHVGVKRPPRVVHLGAPPFPDNSGVHELMIAGNTIHAMVPAALERDRHGIFVGDFTSAHILDTTATLRRPGRDLVAASSAVEGIRVWGWRGDFLVIRQTSLRGFAPTGIRIDPKQQQNTGRLWLVAETMAVDAPIAVTAPGGVECERNYGP